MIVEHFSNIRSLLLIDLGKKLDGGLYYKIYSEYRDCRSDRIRRTCL